MQEIGYQVGELAVTLDEAALNCEDARDLVADDVIARRLLRNILEKVKTQVEAVLSALEV
ncbi:MAG: hypothetical protein M0R06_03620 [Sphaerochaeta sp.]|jgi:hypothetical protein|nr:hypothetical protein [Sphaerochaeta sp.]